MNIGFTGKAQNALNRALYFACQMGHTCVGSEHLMLGLLSEEDGIAARVLKERGVTLEEMQNVVEKNSGLGERTNLSAADMTPRTKKIIEASAGAAMTMGHGYVGTEHLLLAMMDENDCYAVKMLLSEGIQPSDIKRDIISYFGQGGDSAAKGNSSAKNKE